MAKRTWLFVVLGLVGTGLAALIVWAAIYFSNKAKKAKSKAKAKAVPKTKAVAVATAVPNRQPDPPPPQKVVVTQTTPAKLSAAPPKVLDPDNEVPENKVPEPKPEPARPEPICRGAEKLGYPYWGWGKTPNAKACCRRNDNTECKSWDEVTDLLNPKPVPPPLPKKKPEKPETPKKPPETPKKKPPETPKKPPETPKKPPETPKKKPPETPKKPPNNIPAPTAAYAKPFPASNPNKKLILMSYVTWHGLGKPNIGRWRCSWAEPAVGAYANDNVKVIDYHTDALVYAGVDAVLFDLTNNCGNNNVGVETGMYAFCDRQIARKKAGQTFLRYAVHTGQCMGRPNDAACEIPKGQLMPQKVEQMYQELIVKRDPDLYVKHLGKPLFCVGFLPPCEAEVRARFASEKRFTIRFYTIYTAWGGRTDVWGWENGPETWRDPSVSLYNGRPESATITSAVRHGTWNNTGTVHNNKGNTFRIQWDAVIKKNPPVVIIQSWNQWNTDKRSAICTIGGENWDQDRTTDIEPMKGGHGDLYVQILREKAAIYKSR